MTGRVVDLCWRAALPAVIAALVVVGMVLLHYTTAPESTVDLGPFKDIKKISRGTAI